MHVFRPAIRLVRQHARPFMLINFVYFGIVCGGMVYGAWHADARDSFQRQVREDIKGPLAAVAEPYKDGRVLQAIGLTFVINLLGGALLFITLPSFIVPFTGLLLGAVRAFAWGMIFSPDFESFNSTALAYGLLVGILLLLEGEGYVLAILGSYIHGTSFLSPQTAGATSRWQGYLTGASSSLKLYALVATVLALAAIYEATMVIYLLPLVR